MVAHLYPNFLVDTAEYHRAEQFCEKLCNDALTRYSGVHDWRPWCSKTLLDGTPMQEGNPIHDLVSSSTRKGIRIIQEEVRTDKLEVGAWTNTHGGDPGEEGTWDELVISCALSKESAELARQLLVEWVQFEGPRQEFEPTIARILGW